MAKYRLLLFKTPTSGVEITNLCQQIKWKGRKGSAARSMTATLIDDDGAKHDRAGIDVAKGHQVVLELDGDEVFRGIVMRTEESNKKLLSFTAYDNGIYLSNNRDTFCYENRTADYIFRDVTTRFGLPVGDVSPCSYVIPELIKARTTLWDAMADALSLEYDNTQIRHFVSSSKGKLNLLTRKENVLQWVLEPAANLMTYSMTRSIEKTRTRVKLLSDEGTVLAEAADKDMEAQIGVFQDVDYPDETLTLAQLTALVKSICAERAVIENTLTLNALGINDVISGICVFVRIGHLDIARTFYVDEDAHILEGEKHTMRLKLNVANDIVMR